MENFFNNERIFKSLWKWKAHILIAVVAAIVLSVIISSPLFIKPKYKSSGKLYPVNFQVYSEESESEQLLENIRSVDIKFRLIDAFELDKVYKVNRQDPLYSTHMLDKFNKNISFKKTEFESVEIKVLDENPQRASDMVDSLILYFNQMVQAQHAIKYLEVAKIAERDLEKMNKEIDSITAIMNELRCQYGLLDYKSQVEGATAGLMDAEAKSGNTEPAKELIENLKSKGGEFQRMQNQLQEFERVADSLKIQQDWGLSHGTKKISYGIVVENPFPADKKSYPVRWLIVFLTTIATLFVAMVSVLMIDFIRERNSAQ